MSAFKVFLSYSHQDEWLKDELIAHFSALRRNGLDVWHDRLIPAGGSIHDEIDENLHSSNLFLFLISPHFLQSDYCFHKEYNAAVKRRGLGEAEIIPVIVRPCDWDVGELKTFNALPRDGVPVTDNAMSRADVQLRDKAWLQVIEGIKGVIQMLKKKAQPPKVISGYHDSLFVVDFIRHPAIACFDERAILVDPDVYCETDKEQVSSFARLFEICSAEKAVQCLGIFESQFLSAPDKLKKNTIGLFLEEEGNELRFREEYLWFFLCARYVVKFLQTQDHEKYKAFVQHCTANIFQRKFANIVIYMAYFSTDRYVLDCLLQTLDGLFSKASDWIISDDTRDLITGLISKDSLEIESKSDVTENRMILLQEKIADIIDDAARVVARYTLPFLSPRIGDSTTIDNLEVVAAIDHDSYMKSVNALLRTHSVIGQILSGRSGTFSAQLVTDCITRMVKASGRYVSLNHAIAAVLIFDRDKSLEEMRTAFRVDHSTVEEKYEKVKSIFAFWSVYISHAGLARYLNQEHSIRALEKLAAEHDSEDKKTASGNTPFNFTLVKVVARLYNSGRIDRNEIENVVQVYGEHSSIMALLRVVIHMYAYYMPLTIEDKQWVSHKLRMPLRRIEVQRMKAVTPKSRQQAAVL